MPRENPRVYALCRSCKPTKKGMLPSDREITFGFDKTPLIVEMFYMFKNDKEEPIVALEEIGRRNGKILGAVYDSIAKKNVVREIPLDDLVDPARVTSYTI
jgi:hypothetical protein